MTHDLRPTTPDDLPELGRFLAAGFGAPAGAAFAAVDVLRWKYFDPRGDDAGDAPRSYLARDAATGAVVGHVGVCPGKFRGAGLPPEGVATLHMIDWLTSAAGAGVGATLMRRAHRAAATQYGLGGSAAGRGVIDRGGYGLVAAVPVYQRVLRPGYRLRDPSHGPAGRLARAAKDAAGRLLRPARAPGAPAVLRPVGSFEPGADPVPPSYAARAAFTSRGPGLLNHALRYPRGGLTGWQVARGGVVRGFGVLSVVPRDGGHVREGRVVDCALDDPDDPDLWHAAVAALAAALADLGADLAVLFASTPWSARAAAAAGFASVHALEFRLRDRRGLLPRGAPFHLTPLEADYAYT